MNVSRGEIWKVAQLRREGLLALHDVVRVGDLAGVLEGGRIEAPHLQ